METKKSGNQVFPQRPLTQAIRIVRDEKLESPSLNIKLQEEWANPINNDLRLAASSLDYITKLKTVI